MTIHKEVICSGQMSSDGDLRGKRQRRVIAIVRRAEVEVVEVDVSFRALTEPERLDRGGHLSDFGIIARAGDGIRRQQVIVDREAELAGLVSIARAPPKVRAVAV